MTVLKCLWRVLDFCRRLVLNLIFLGVLAAAALIWLFARPNTPAVEPGTLLVLDLDGTVVESDPLRSISADLKSLMKSRGASTRLIDVTEALRFAGSDERIAGVIIKVDGLTKLGLASAARLAVLSKTTRLPLANRYFPGLPGTRKHSMRLLHMPMWWRFIRWDPSW